jgi:hypothetical protein
MGAVMIDFTAAIRDEVRGKFAEQFEGFLKIERKGGEVVRPVANVHQLRLDAAVKAAQRLGRPCRIIALKPRQKGSSTGSVGIGHVRLKAKRGRGLIAGGKHFQGANLFRILKTYADNDELDPKFCKVMDMEARYKNGSMMQRITLASGDAGRSGTYQFLAVTEAAYLADEGVANADVVLDGLLKCVPLEPDTIIIVESTANGASGYFFDTWQGGISLEEFEAGRQGYIQIFSAWFEFDDSRLDPATMGIASEADFTQQEDEYVADLERDQGIRLDLWQVAWMRYAIKEECRGDWDKFMQDYPKDADTAFLKSGRCFFESSGIAHQERLVKVRPAEYGYLSYNEAADRVTWVRTDTGQARSVRWETPRVGCRYLISVDSASGEDQTGGSDPDSHSVLVHRAGYLQNGRWSEPAIVMRNMLVPGYKPGSLVCWWSNDVLVEEVWRMARYWQAVVVPEENHDRGLIEALKLRGDVDIYQRELFNRRENVRTKALGWQTTTRTRPMMLETLASAIREAGRGDVGVGYEVRGPWVLGQMKNFGTKPSGRLEALIGHDDDVLSLAIGCQTLDYATPWFERDRDEWVPRDLRDMGGGGGRGCSQWT